MFTTLRNAWKIPELRKKILFTLFVLLIYRLGACVPVPYVNVAELTTYFSQQLSDTVLGLYNAMSGSAFSQATIFAIGIQPYINASIIIELLAIAIPALERLAKEGGEEGQKKIQRITRYTTVGLALLMGFAYYVMLKNYNLLNETGFLAGLVIVVTFMAGASFLMWMGEQIDQFGIGNGISMILFAGIISRIPSLVSALVSSLASGAIKWYTAILLVLGMLLIVVFIVFITKCGFLILGQILDADIRVDLGHFQDLLSACSANTVDVGQTDLDSLLTGQVNTSNTCHLLQSTSY